MTCTFCCDNPCDAPDAEPGERHAARHSPAPLLASRNSERVTAVTTVTPPSHTRDRTTAPHAPKGTPNRMEKLLLTPEEAAELLSVGRSKVYDLIRSQALASVKIGGSRRIPAGAVQAYVDSLVEVLV
jgi:excisionase family DNA binding protein